MGTIDRAPTLLVCDWFVKTASETPEAIAIVSGEDQLSFADLDRVSATLASDLAQRGVGPEVCVGLMAESSLELVIGILGILRAGGAFVPLSPSYPSPRLEHMLSVASPEIVLATPAHTAHPALRETTVLTLDAAFERSKPSALAPVVELAANNLAYVIFTSGSTGLPKGVALSHAGIPHLVRTQVELFAIGPGSRVLQFASPSFDAAVSEIFTTLCAGATLIVVEPAARAQPDRLTRLLVEQRVTTSTFPPSLLRLLAPTDLPDLRTVVSAGEACTAEIVERWAGAGRRLVNAYGPTENTVCSTGRVCLDDGEAPPIGPPMDYVSAQVLDQSFCEVALGDIGELYVGGPGVARGYLDNPRETAARFLPDLLAREPGARMYRTGDLVRRRPNGELEYVGRTDDQIKLRGFRIELGEIEACLLANPDVSDAAVVVQRLPTGEPILAAFVRTDAPVASLRAYCRMALPSYLVPSRINAVGALPITPNGKVDRARLASSAIEIEISKRPVGQAEEIVAAAFCEVLGYQEVDVEDSFFDIGGDSLAALRLIATLEIRFVRKIPIALLFEHRSVRGITAALDSSAPSRPFLPLSRLGQKAPLWLLPPVHGSGLCYLDLVQSLLARELRPVYALQAPGVEAGTSVVRDFDELIAHYLDALVSEQPEGPYLLGGWSLGASFAYEMAARLSAKGEKVLGLVLIGPTAPDEEHLRTARSLLGEYAVPKLAYMYVRSFCHSQGTQVSVALSDFEGLNDVDAIDVACRALAGVGPYGVDVEHDLIRCFVDIYGASLYAFHHHQPSPGFAGDSIIITSEMGRPFLQNNPVVSQPLPFGPWEDFLHGEIEYHTVPGDHFRMVSGPFSEPVSDVLSHWLRARGI